MDERVYLKVKIKSLGEEARIIRKETRKARSLSIKEGLYRHRIDVVRPEARFTHLAYGFIRGRLFKQIENKSKVAPDWRRVRKMVEKYGLHLEPYYWNSGESYSDLKKRREEHQIQQEQLMERFDAWVEQAKEILAA